MNHLDLFMEAILNSVRIKYNGTLEDAKAKLAEFNKKNPDYKGSVIVIPEKEGGDAIETGRGNAILRLH